MPVGSLHSFKNESGKPARMLITIEPAGLQQMFLEVGQSVAHDARAAPPPSQSEIEKLPPELLWPTLHRARPGAVGRTTIE